MKIVYGYSYSFQDFRIPLILSYIIKIYLSQPVLLHDPYTYHAKC